MVNILILWNYKKNKAGRERLTRYGNDGKEQAQSGVGQLTYTLRFLVEEEAVGEEGKKRKAARNEKEKGRNHKKR